MKRIPAEPGHRDKLVTIQQASDGVDASGVPSETWTALATVFMGRRGLSGSERWQSHQEASQFDTHWQMAYRVDMDPDLVDVPKSRRLVYRGRALDIVSAEHLGRQEGIALMTRASTAVA